MRLLLSISTGEKKSRRWSKVKRHCFVLSISEWIDANDFDDVGTGVGSRDGGGGAGQVHTVGLTTTLIPMLEPCLSILR